MYVIALAFVSGIRKTPDLARWPFFMGISPVLKNPDFGRLRKIRVTRARA